MRLCTLICEGMLYSDLSGQSFPGMGIARFDPRPAVFSADALMFMTRGIADRVKVRLIANFWPARYDPKAIDPEASFSSAGKVVAMEPDAHQWSTLKGYLDGPRPHDWLIYWPTIGHCDGYRLPHEDKGIPANIRDTTSRWLDMVREELLPRLDCPVLIHTDHGTARTGHPNWKSDGFAFVPSGMIDKSQVNWDDIQELEKKCLGLES